MNAVVIGNDSFVTCLLSYANTISCLSFHSGTVQELGFGFEEIYEKAFEIQISVANKICKHNPSINFVTAFNVASKITVNHIERNGWPVHAEELMREVDSIASSTSVIQHLTENNAHNEVVNSNLVSELSLISAAAQLGELFSLLPMGHANKYLLEYSLTAISMTSNEYILRRIPKSEINSIVSRDVVGIVSQFWMDSWIKSALNALNPERAVLDSENLIGDLSVFGKLVEQGGYGHEKNAKAVVLETANYIVNLARAKAKTHEGILSKGQTELMLVPMAKLGIVPLAQTAWHRILEKTAQQCKKMSRDELADWLEKEVTEPLSMGIFFSELKTLVDLRPRVQDMVSVDPEIVDADCSRRLGIATEVATSLSKSLSKQ